MQPEKKKDFDKEAAQWDANPGRVKLANEVADAIIREAAPARDMDVLDFGCGTGLVTLRLQPLVRTILGVDSSLGMLGVLEGKIRTQGIANARTRFVDFEKGGRVEGGFHLLVSSMTLHHVPDTARLFKQWHELLLPGGLLSFADLDAEDGSFHGDNTGVFHTGFDREHLKKLLLSAGFHDVRDTTATTMLRDVEGRGKKEFPVFLIVAKK
ncbi:MAG: class I SAM-dependent methyltransferase [Nitrospirae bacterium]|nr:class I SAM-dependent methyltransferase [Nitrospirota bacterium]